MDLTLILAAGVASGTVLLFAAVGEIFAERSGVLNLGVEGMMLMGAVAGFSTAVDDRQPVDRPRRGDARRRRSSACCTASSPSTCAPTRSSPAWR